MQRTKQDISALIKKGETFHLECKKTQGGLPSSLWESYSAFCNTDNKTLQKMFQFLGYSEKAGSGFPKIFMGTDEQHWERPTLREDFQLDQTYLNMPTVDLSEDSPTVNIGAESDQNPTNHYPNHYPNGNNGIDSRGFEDVCGSNGSIIGVNARRHSISSGSNESRRSNSFRWID